MRKCGKPAAFLMLRKALVIAPVGSVRIHGIVCPPVGARRRAAGEAGCNARGSEPPSFCHRAKRKSIDSFALLLSGIVRCRYVILGALTNSETAPFHIDIVSPELPEFPEAHRGVHHDDHAVRGHEPFLFREGHVIQALLFFGGKRVAGAPRNDAQRPIPSRQSRPLVVFLHDLLESAKFPVDALRDYF